MHSSDTETFHSDDDEEWKAIYYNVKTRRNSKRKQSQSMLEVGKKAAVITSTAEKFKGLVSISSN